MVSVGRGGTTGFSGDGATTNVCALNEGRLGAIGGCCVDCFGGGSEYSVSSGNSTAPLRFVPEGGDGKPIERIDRIDACTDRESGV